ncbi:hypothetical protein AAC387_Pa08g0292 [Persea americana]
MGENLSKKTSNQNLAQGVGGGDGTIANNLPHANFRSAFRSLSFNTLIEFTNSPLEMDDEDASIMIECKSPLWGDKIFSRTFLDYFSLTSKMLDSLRKNNEAEEEDHRMMNLLKELNERYESLEQRLMTQNSKINPMMRTYGKLQFAAQTLVMIPFIGPITWALLSEEKQHAAAAAAATSFAFVAFGVAGRWASCFCERRKEELKVKEVIIGLMLASITSQKRCLNRISDLVNGGMQDGVVSKAIENSHVRIERKIILQKLSEYVTSSRGYTLEEDLNEKYQSLEQQLMTHNSKINPKMKSYRKLQFAAKTLVMITFIGPITRASLAGEKLHAAAATRSTWGGWEMGFLFL